MLTTLQFCWSLPHLAQALAWRFLSWPMGVDKQPWYKRRYTVRLQFITVIWSSKAKLGTINKSINENTTICTVHTCMPNRKNVFVVVVAFERIVRAVQRLWSSSRCSVEVNATESEKASICINLMWMGGRSAYYTHSLCREYREIYISGRTVMRYRRPRHQLIHTAEKQIGACIYEKIGRHISDTTTK